MPREFLLEALACRWGFPRCRSQMRVLRLTVVCGNLVSVAHWYIVAADFCAMQTIFGGLISVRENEGRGKGGENEMR